MTFFLKNAILIVSKFSLISKGIYIHPQIMSYESNLCTVKHCTNVNGYYFLKSLSLFFHKTEREGMAVGMAEEEKSKPSKEPAGAECPLLRLWGTFSLVQQRLDKALDGDRQQMKGL